FLCFVTSCLLGVLLPPLNDRFQYPVHTWTWWTVKNVRDRCSTIKSERTEKMRSNQKERSEAGERPDCRVVLLGSSLMVVAMAECDSTWLKERIDLTTYRDARYFDERIQHLFDRNPGTLNLSAPGQVPSDAYLTLKFALKQGIKPDLIVYGLAPRDFLDGTMQSPFDSECYRYLNRLVPAVELNAVLNDGSIESVFRSVCSSTPILERSIDL